jgi:glyoxalase family protein
MSLKVGGFHHITAISKEIAENIGFYTGVMGMRLVKKSVNQDDTSAYHLFYADKVGSPGTDITFFDWSMAAQNRPGGGSVALTTFAVADTEALDWWQERLSLAGVHTERDEDILGRDHLVFADPEGQTLGLVVAKVPTATEPWDATVPVDKALHGFLGVDLASLRPDGTRWVLELLGFQPRHPAGLFDVSSEHGIAEVGVTEDATGRHAMAGAGGVHHVAFRVPGDEELHAFQDLLESKGLKTSGIIDRFWFHSLYFREPGGVLFELATEGPGFGRDEQMDRLGESIVLPPFLEGRRAEIESKLKVLPPPAYIK